MSDNDDSKQITSANLPGGLSGVFPGTLKNLTLEEIIKICGK